MNLASRAWRRNPAEGHPPAFPPGVVVAVKALVCELPHRCGLPLSRWSLADIEREVVGEGIVAQISGSTPWRWLSREALCPWRNRSWIFPRDPNFALKADRSGGLSECYQRTPIGASYLLLRDPALKERLLFSI